MHTKTITKADRAALENLWGVAGSFVADTWSKLNTSMFAGKLIYHGVVWGLTPHGRRLGHTHCSGRITLHPALLDPQGARNVWSIPLAVLGERYAADVLLHEMIHVLLFDPPLALQNGTGAEPHHNTREWCDEISRLSPLIGLGEIKAEPVHPRRINGKSVRKPKDSYLDRCQIAGWPHTLRPRSFYLAGNKKIDVPI